MPTGVEITEDEIVINAEPQFFKQLGNLLNSTSKRTIANYLFWRVILETSAAQPASFRQLGFISSA